MTNPIKRDIEIIEQFFNAQLLPAPQNLTLRELWELARRIEGSFSCAPERKQGGTTQLPH